jgi:amino acid adenylation domain-containing protein/non-ribosomal peptide synthase protein (TIGR01720 family)
MTELTGFRLSPQQTTIWQQKEKYSEQPAQLLLKVKGDLAIEVLKKSIEKIIEQDTIFRTTYAYTANLELPIQVVNESGEFIFIEQPEKEASITEAEFIKQAQTQDFDFENGPLIRVDLAKKAERINWILITVPALCIDYSSLQVVANELIQAWTDPAGNTQAEEIEPLPYLQFSEWQNQLLETEEKKEGDNYWKTKLPLQKNYNLPFDKDQTRTQGNLSDVCSFKLNDIDTQVLNQVAAADPFFGFCWQLLMWIYTGKQNNLTGHNTTGRDFQELSRTIGLLSRTLPMDIQMDENSTVKESLKQYEVLLSNHDEYKGFYPGDQNRRTGDPAFAYTFEFSDVSIHTGNPVMEVEIAHRMTTSEAAKLQLNCTRKGEELWAEFQFSKNNFDTESIALLARAYETIIKECIADPGKRLAEINVLSLNERQDITEKFNQHTKVFARSGMSVVELFEEEVIHAPDSIALIAGNVRLTYKELNERASGLANYLYQKLNISKGDYVAIMCEENEHLIIGMLAILKAGATYVPVDVNNPAERIRYILNNCSAKVVLSVTAITKEFNFEKTQLVCLDKLTGIESAEPSLKQNRTTDSSAYVIYTSGTTGNPKGVIIPDKALVNYVCWLKDSFNIKKEDQSVLLSSYAFDLGYTSLWGTLLNGACLHLLPENTSKEGTVIVNYLAQASISYIKTTPTFFNILINASNLHQLKESKLRLIIVGGEPIRIRDLEFFAAIKPDVEFVNHYGPTESTIGTIATRLDKEKFNVYKSLPVIGKPISNSYITIIDQNNEPVAPGIAGELCISGAGLASGYLDQQELTDSKFVPHPFKNEMSMYRSGDQAKWMPDGSILFTGRVDDQVKIRGYRVELAEVENVLQVHPEVSAAVVITKEDVSQEKELIAYIVSRSSLNVADLREYLGKRVPSYMIPLYFIELAAFPLTANGKVDKRKLPQPDGNMMSTGTAYVAPRSEEEKILVHIYEEVLKKKNIGIKEDFFALGGDSIKSIQVVSLLRQKGFMLTIQDVLLNPVIEELAKKIILTTQSVDQGAVTGMIPLSPAQKAFFENEFTLKHHYNQTVLLSSKKAIAGESIRAALSKMVAHHDGLRMVFRNTAAGWIQENKGLQQTCSFESLEYIDADHFEATCAKIQSGIDLENGPLLKVALFKNLNEDRLLLVAHHLVIDGVSWRIFLEDLFNLYQQHLSGQPFKLPLKTDSFKLWMEHQVAYASGGLLKKEEAYWSQLESMEVQPLPLDYPEGSNLVKDRSVQSFELDEDTSSELLTKCYKAHCTEINEILITAFSLAVRDIFGTDKLQISLEGHGREQLGTAVDVTRTIGWFTSLYPVVIDISHQDTIRQLIEVKENLHRVPNKGIGYGILRYLANKDYRLKPQIIFNYFGNIGSEVNAGQPGSALTFSSEKHGSALAENMPARANLDVSGIVVEGKLSMQVNYSSKQYAASTITRLLKAYEDQLKALITKLSTEEKEYLSPVDLTYKSLNLEQVLALNKDFNLEDAFPFSPLQEGIYFHWLEDPSSYQGQMYYQLKGAMDMKAIEKSYQLLVSRHSALRSSFTHAGGELLQVVTKKVPNTFTYIDLSKDKNDDVEACRVADRKKGFDLEQGTQMRLTVLDLGDQTYEFIWLHHHIVMDGWCVTMLIQEFFQIYDHLIRKEAVELKKVHPYSNYINWLMNIDKESSFAYWREYLSGYTTLSTIPKVYSKSKKEYKATRQSFTWNAGLSESIRKFCKENGLTESTFLQVAWGIVLGKYNNTDDVVFGVVVSGRPPEVEGIEDMIGLFINTIPLRVNASVHKTVKELLRDAQQTLIQGINHHYTQLAQIQSETELGRELFDHVLVFENYPIEEVLQQGVQHTNSSAAFTLLSSGGYEKINYDFSITISSGDAIQVTFKYNELLYEPDFLLNLQHHFEETAKQMVENKEIHLTDIDFLSRDEKIVLLEKFNSSAVVYPKNKTIIDLFSEQVKKTPQHIAVITANNSLTYQELDEKSNQLANYLLEHYNVTNEEVIGILLDRSDRLIIAILAIWKAGAAYVPVDMEFPRSRKEYIFQDTHVKLLLTQSDCIFDLEYFSGQLFAMDIQFDALESPMHMPKMLARPSDLAYIIYTSGSTGQSKGVMIEHGAIVNTVQAQQTIFQVKEGDRGLQFASISFDASVWELFAILTSGATLCIISESSKKDPESLEAFIVDQQISFATLPPAYMQLLRTEKIKSIRQLVTAGEAAATDEALAFAKYGTYYNAYGPTESSICATIFKIEQEARFDSPTIPIGKPIPNTTIYILDRNEKLLPLGATGEICIGGAGLARGYLNQSLLTAEKFITNPFNTNERIYKTGDHGKWLPDGNLEFIGRKDDQVKMSGYRIELGEIENVLKKHDQVAAATVVVKINPNKEKELVAYVLCKEMIEVADLRAYLGDALPSYMIPEQFVYLKELPLTSNGKVDKKRLPEPEKFRSESKADYVAPRNETEEKLTVICKEILGLDQIGVRDNFFDVGGHSLKAMRFITQIRKDFQVSLNMEEIFENATIEFVAEEITRRKWAMEKPELAEEETISMKI